MTRKLRENRLRLGAKQLEDDRTHFRVWAPQHDSVMLHLTSPVERLLPMERGRNGYFNLETDAVGPGAEYFYKMSGGPDRPDPASRIQLEGVHGPTSVPDETPFAWVANEWRGMPLEGYVIYELHVGTFTSEGTFDAVIERLDALADLGVTAVELMPVAQFPGTRNWGYDGVYPFAVQDSYGGREGLCRLVDAAHQRGLAVILDVVYNHLGPEGNYLNDFGPYFTARYRTPWGAALNFDGEYSDEVRSFFIESALMWISEFRIDGLRVDAVHAIVDHSARPFLAELADEVHRMARQLGRMVHLFAESDLNDPIVLRSLEHGGLGYDAHWADDFHHAVHTLLTGEQESYYADFGKVSDLATVLRDGYLYAGRYSEFRKRRFGAPPATRRGEQFVISIQNHDQVGNRMRGERLSTLVSFDKLKLAAGVMLLAPMTPMLWMGEEYGETAPFLYFMHHSDDDLVEAVRRGRREEFAGFEWKGEVPDPHAESTYEQSRIGWKWDAPRPSALRTLYKRLLQLRFELPALADPSLSSTAAWPFESSGLLLMVRGTDESRVAAIYNFSEKPARRFLPLPAGNWRVELNSSSVEFGGSVEASELTLRSRGEYELELPAASFLLLLEVPEES